MPTKFVPALIVLAALSLTGCSRTLTRDGAIDPAQVIRADAATVPAELCRTWGMSLPTRSRADTPQTAREIEEGYGDFAAACPEFMDLIPE
tara:strand:+ start:76 stop:348 length:273 start_codon:yes stop_codon:yes gene_type:complete